MGVLAHLQMLLEAAGGGTSYNSETTIWFNAISAAGGSTTTTDRTLADALIVALQGKSYNTKVIWLAPWLTNNIKGARMPLRDTRGAGMMNSYGSSPFVDADVGNAVGIQNPTEKNAYLGTNIPINWNSANGNKAGYGWWERNWGNGSNVEPFGAYNSGNSSRFVLDFRSTFRRGRYGGTTQSEAGPASSMVNDHYYFQYDGTKTQLYKGGATDGSANTTGPFAGSIDGSELFVMGVNASPDAPWKGRSGVAYITDGTMSGADISDFHTLLNTYLISATGR